LICISFFGLNSAVFSIHCYQLSLMCPCVQGSLLTELVGVKSRFTSDSTYISYIYW